MRTTPATPSDPPPEHQPSIQPQSKQPLNLIIYPSPLFAAHWAFFLPSIPASSSPTANLAKPHIGTRIHADGSPLTGFTLLVEEDYDLKSSTQSYNIVELQEDVDVEAFLRVARGVGVPGKSLVGVEAGEGEEDGDRDREKGDGDKKKIGPRRRRRVEMKNCQTWVLDVVGRLVEEGLVGEEVMGVVRGAPRN